MHLLSVCLIMAGYFCGLLPGLLDAFVIVACAASHQIGNFFLVWSRLPIQRHDISPSPWIYTLATVPLPRSFYFLGPLVAVSPSFYFTAEYPPTHTSRANNPRGSSRSRPSPPGSDSPRPGPWPPGCPSRARTRRCNRPRAASGRLGRGCRCLGREAGKHAFVG